MSDAVVQLVSPQAPTAKKPTVSLCLVTNLMLAPRSLEKMGPAVDEVVVVLAGCEETARDAFASWLERHPVLGKKPSTIIAVDHESRPDIYRADIPETFQVGTPLAGESYPGPYSGSHFVADWSSVRNLGLGRCASEWRLCLGRDELVADPGQIAATCAVLDEHRRDLGFSTCRRSDDPPRGRSVLSGRLSRNLPAIRWEGVARETLEGCLRPAVVDDLLVVHHEGLLANPLPGDDDAAAFRALYSEARACDWSVPPANLLHMARTARHAGMPDFTTAAVNTYLDNSLYPEERAWARAIMGDHHEAQGNAESASSWYERSLEEHPTPKSAYRLSRARFHQGRWQECVDAHQLGISMQNVVQLADDGPESPETNLVHVAAALHELGRHAEARETAELLRVLFPNCCSVRRLCETIG